MKTLLALIILIATPPICEASDMIMRDYGVYSFSGAGFNVVVDLKNVAEGRLAPKITFKEGDLISSTGIGERSSLAVVPGRWIAQFRPPYELWIYDGTSKLQLYERTVEARGFKGTSSSSAPELLDRVPPELKRLMSERHN